MSPEGITHRAPGFRVDFDARGVTLRPLLAGAVFLAWEELEFICVTPAMERHAGGWRQKTFSFLPRGFRTTLETHGHLGVELVVRDRRPVLARTQGRWTRFWLTRHLVPMLDAWDARKVDQSLVGLDLYKHRLSAPLDALLDLMDRHCRFDLVVH